MSSRYTESARDKDCQVRVPGYCNFDTSTTVLAHLNGGGMGTKCPDWQGSFSCSSCHDIVDFRVKTEYSRVEIKLWHHEGVARTQRIWNAMGWALGD